MPKRKTQIDHIEKWSTVISTIITGIALVVSIMVMSDTKTQNKKNLEEVKKQLYRDSISDLKSLIRDDSIFRINNQINHEHLEMIKEQIRILKSQYNVQKNEFYANSFNSRPIFDAQLLNIHEDENINYLEHTLKNIGKRDVFNVIVKGFWIIPEFKCYLASNNNYSKALLKCNDSINYCIKISENQLKENEHLENLKIYIILVEVKYFDMFLNETKTDYLGYKGDLRTSTYDLIGLDQMPRVLKLLSKCKKIN